MKNILKTTWNYSNGQVSIDPYRQKIIHQSGFDRHSDAMESVEILSQYIQNSTVISPFIRSNIELLNFEKEINQAVEYYLSRTYIQEYETIFNAQPTDLIDYSSTLTFIRKKKNRSFIVYLAFILLLNTGIYAATLLNEKIVYMFIISSLVTVILIYTMFSEFISNPKFVKGMILSVKTGKPILVAGKQIPSTSFFIVVGQQYLYDFKNNQIDIKDFIFKNEITYQVSKELYDKYKTSGSYINFITSSKNEIFTIVSSYI